jgi:membrane-anchored glycerophosphoryl diester phosphodiesterase (GDPDase)
MFAMIILIFYIAVRLAPALATVITEDQSATTAIARSWQITHGFFSHVFIAQILMSVAILVVDLVIGIIAAAIILSFIPSVDIALIIASVTASLLLSPLNYIFLAVLYKDLEARGIGRKYVWWN